MTRTFTVRKTATTFFLEIEGGQSLNVPFGLLPEPILSVRGGVLLEVKVVNGRPRFELDFNGTFRVMYLGNLGSVAGRFVLDTNNDPIDDPDNPGQTIQDALSVREFLTDLGVDPQDMTDSGFDTLLPKLWGVVKFETNLDVLKNIGLDLKSAGILEVNTTRTLKTETITLEGIPGDELTDNTGPVRVAVSEGMAGELDSGTLPDVISTAFATAGNALQGAPEVFTVIGGLLWRVEDAYLDQDGKPVLKQYFIQKADLADLNATESDLRFLLRGDTQTFDLQAKTLLVASYGQAIFRLPPFTDVDKTELGPEWFRASGAFALKVSTSEIKLFFDGVLSLTPAGQDIAELRATAALFATPDGLAGKFLLSANVDFPGVLLRGDLIALVNTFTVAPDGSGTEVTIDVPVFLQDVVGFDTVDVPLRAPKLNEDFGVAGDTRVIVDDPDASPGSYFTIAASAELLIGPDSNQPVLTMTGAFHLLLTPEGLDARALVGTVITLPGENTPLFELTGSMAFAIDADGFYGTAELSLNVGGGDEATFLSEFTLEAKFLLEFNTAGVVKEIETFTLDSANPDFANKISIVTVALPAETLRLVAFGNLQFTPGSTAGDAFTMVGRFEFVLAPDLFEIQASASLTMGSLVDAEATGAMRLARDGGTPYFAGFINIDVSAGSGDQIAGTGFELNFNLALFINTRASSVSFGGVTLSAQTVRLEASGFLQITIGGVAGFRVEGELLVVADGEGFAVSVEGQLSAQVAGATLIRMGASGNLLITNAGTAQTPIYAIAGRLTLTQDVGGALDGNGFIFDASFTFELNTTNQAVDFDGDGTVDLVAGIYARVHADGDLGFQVASGTGFLLRGAFDLEVGSNGLTVAAAADLLAQAGGQTILKLGAVGALLINSSGIAAKISLSVGGGASTGGSGFSFGGTFTFELNTTGQAIAQIGGVNVNLSAERVVRLSITNAFLQLSINGANSFRLEGGFLIQGGSGGLEVGATGSLKVKVGNTTLLDLSASGALLIGPNGIAAKITLSLPNGFSGTGFKFTGSFVLSVNTTGQFVGSIAGQQVGLAAGRYGKLEIQGTLKVLNLLDLSGSFVLQVGSSGLNVQANVTLRIFSVGFKLNANLVIGSSGLVFRGTVSLSNASAFIPFKGIQLSGSVILEINTTSSSATVGGVSIPRQTVRFSIVNATVNILGFKATGNITISIGSGGFRIDVPSNKPLTLKVGPIEASLSGFVDSNGSFLFTATSKFKVTAKPAFLEATASVTLGSSQFRINVKGEAGLKIAGVKISVKVEADVKISGTSLEVKVTGKVNLLFKTVKKSVTFKLGSISPPGEPQTDPEPVLATLLSGGVLRLNVGSYAFARKAPGLAGEIDETFNVTHAGTSAGRETVTVAAFGFEQTYAGVTKILVVDAGSGDDSIDIDAGVTSDAEIHGGSGNDSLVYLGSGVARLNGGAGDDLLLVSSGNGHVLDGGSGADDLIGGTGNDTLNGGSGNDTLVGDSGNDTLNGGAGSDSIQGDGGNDTIVWKTGDGVDTLIDGGAGSGDRLSITLTNGNDSASFDAPSSGTGFRTTVGGVTLSAINTEIADLFTLAGSDTVTVNHLGASTLREIRAALGSDSVADSVIVNATAFTDNYTLTASSSANTATVARNGGVSVIVEQANLGGAGLTLNLDDGADTVTVQQTLASVVTTVNGGLGNDTVRVSPDSNVNAIAGLLLVRGDGGSDTLQVDDKDENGAETANLTSDRIWGLGMPNSSATSRGITYQGVEALNLRLGMRSDTVNVRSLAAGSTTTISTGSGSASNTVLVSSAASTASGNVNSIAGKLVVLGQSSSDILEVIDKDDAGAESVFVTSSRIWGLGMPGSDVSQGGITYSGVNQLNLRLGTRADTISVRGTSAGTATTIETGAGQPDTIHVGSGAPGVSGDVNNIAGQLILKGQSGSDTLNVVDKDEGAAETGYLTAGRIWGLDMPGSTATQGGVTYQNIEILNLLLGARSDTIHVRGTAGATVTTVETGTGTAANTIHVGDTTSTLNAVAGRLVVRGQSSADTVVADDSGDGTGNVDGVLTSTRLTGLGTGTASAGIEYDGVETLTVRLGTGGDVFAVRSTSATTLTTIETGSGAAANRVHVGTAAGGVNQVAGKLVVQGQGSNDTLEVDDSGDGLSNTGTLTGTRLTGLGMGANSTALGIQYHNLEQLQISLGIAGDQLTVENTHAGHTAVDTLNGPDRIAIRSIAGPTVLNAGAGSDIVHVGSLATTTGNAGGNVLGIGFSLTIHGDLNATGNGDVLTVDDTGFGSGHTGQLTADLITGLGMPGSITYHTIEALNVNLGGGGNVFTLQSTHSGETNVNAGTGSDTVNIGSEVGLPRPVSSSHVGGIGGLVTVNGQGNADTLNVDNGGDTQNRSGILTDNDLTGMGMLSGARIVYLTFEDLVIWLGTGNDNFFIESTHSSTETTLHGGNETAVDNQVNDVININSIANLTTINAGWGNDIIRSNYDGAGNPTFQNGIGATLVLHGQAGSDLYEIGLAGFGSSVINVSDPADDPNDFMDNRPNRMKVYGTPGKDYFLFRPRVIAAVGLDGQGNQTGLAERINYNSTINDVAVYGGDEADTFVMDDTSSPLTLYGEAGDDVFQIGQIFQSPRHPADLPAGSDPTGFDPGLDPEDYFRTTLTTRGYLSNGNGEGNPTAIYGGVGNDSFTVYGNKADLFLFGEEDDDSFVVRAFVNVDPDDPKAPFTNINGGQGADFISFTVNAPVNIEGGDGFDTLTVIGTDFGDDFVINDRGILGAGLFVRYGGLEKIVVDALEGNDTFFIQSTPESVAIEVVGGLGSDIFRVGGGNAGEAITVVANDLLGHSGLITHQTSSDDPRYQAVFAQGVSVNVADNDAPGVVLTLLDGPIRVFEHPMADPTLVQARYAIVLSRSPLENVQVSAVPGLPKRSEEQAGGAGVAINGKLDGVTLLFDQSNWFIPQILTVSAPDDALAEGTRDVLIQHSVQQGGSADDGGVYDKLSIPTVVARVIDDDAAGVVVASNPVDAVVTEAGRHAATYSYSVVLTRKPLTNIQVNIGSDGQVATSSPSLTFTPANWFTAQTVIVTAAADTLPEGFHYSRIAHQLDSAVSSDDFYALTLADVTRGLSAEIKGDDGAQFEVEDDITPNVITVTGTGGSFIDARNLSGSAVALSGTTVVADDLLDIQLAGSADIGEVWSVTLDGSAVFDFTVTSANQPLASIARGLRDLINSRSDYRASIVGSTIIVRRVDGSALAADAQVTGQNSNGTMSVLPVSVYSSLDITLSGAVQAGAAWSVLLNGDVFTYLAGENGESRQINSVDVKIVDDEVAGVLVQETLGNTSVIEPSDLVLLGSGQVRTTADPGASVNLVLNAGSPALVAGVSITGAGLQKSGARATISGSAVWLRAVVALDVNVTAYPVWELTLTSGNTVSTFAIDSQGITDNQVLATALAAAIDADSQYSATALGDGSLEITDANGSSVGFTARMTRGRASITGAAAWRQLNIALTGSIAVGDTVKVSLSSDNGATFQTYSVTVQNTSPATTLSDVAEDLVDKIVQTPPAMVTFASASRGILTQFVGDFGTAVMNETLNHDNAFDAQPIDFGSWGTSANPEIENDTTVPHLTIKGSGDGATDFYRFVITQAMIDAALAAGLDGVEGRFDIDHGYEGVGTYWGSQLRLYEFATVDGSVVANLVPNGASPELAVGTLDEGSSTRLDALLTYTFTAPGVYALEVLNWLGPKVSINQSIGLPKGVLYDLHVSLPYHEVATFTFAQSPVLENESLQNPGQQLPGSTHRLASQDIDDATLWFTFDDDSIGNGSTIDSSVPYVTVIGSGNGTYDEYRFVIDQEMLSRAAGDFAGSTDDNLQHTYYTSVTFNLAGSVGLNDEWVVSINGQPFRYKALAANTDQVNDLDEVAAGLLADFTNFIATKSGDTVPTYTMTVAGHAVTITDPNGFWIELEQMVANAGVVTRNLSTVSNVLFDTVILALAGTPHQGETWQVLINGSAAPFTHTLGTAQDLDQVGNALAALDGNATYDSNLNTLTITGLGGVSVDFVVTGIQSDGIAVIRGTPAQQPSVNATSVNPTPVETYLVTEAQIQLGGTPRHNQSWTVTLTDSQGNPSTSTSVVGQTSGAVATLAEIAAGFTAPQGYFFTPDDATLKIQSSQRFTVEITVTGAGTDGSQSTSGTAGYHSQANVVFAGTPHLGETWSIRITESDGTVNTHDYVVGDTDGDGVVDSDGDLVGADGLDLVDVAEGLRRVIGSIASRSGGVLTLTDQAGIKVELLPVLPAVAEGSIVVDTTDSVHAVTRLEIDHTGLPVAHGQVWTLTLDGVSYTYTVPSTGAVDADAIGNAFETSVARNDTVPAIPGDFVLTYDSGTKVLTVRKTNGVPFAGEFRADSVVPPVIATTASSWTVLELELHSPVTPIRPGEIWSLTLGGVTHTVMVGTTTLQQGNTVITTLADIQLASTRVSLGETWHLTLTRPDGTVVVDQSYIVADAVSDGTIDLRDVAAGLAGLISGAIASGTVVQYTDSIGVVAALTVTPAPIDATATFSGTFAAEWTQSIEFTGGTGGASTTGDSWKLVIAGQTFTQQAAADGLAQVAADFHATGLGTAHQVVDPGGGSILTFRRPDGALVPVTVIEQIRNRTAVLVDAQNLLNRDLRPHYSTAVIALDSAIGLSAGDLWKITLNGHDFTYPVQKNDNLRAVAEALKDEINSYTGVYSATRQGSTLTVTPAGNAWFTGIHADASEGSGVVKGLFDIDNANTIRGFSSIGFFFGQIRFFYTASLFLEIYGPTDPTTGNAALIQGTHNRGPGGNGQPDPGSNSLLDPFLEYDFTVAGTYVVRVGSHRDYDLVNPFFADSNGGVARGLSYELNISLQRHATNDDAIELVGKQIRIVDGAGEGNTGRIVAYDAATGTYTVDQDWTTPVAADSKFEIEYHLEDEFSGYEPVNDAYSMVLTSPPAADEIVTIDVLPQITRTLNASLTFVAEANYGENAAVQVLAATPQVLVELNGSPLAGQTWTLTLNGVEYSYPVVSGDDLEAVAEGLSQLIHGAELDDAETFVAIQTENSILVRSSRYLDQINGVSMAPTATPFTAEFSISPDTAGRAEISPRDGVSGWLTADVDLIGSVAVGDAWTLRLDGVDYTYHARLNDDLTTVAQNLVALLPAIYQIAPDPVNGPTFSITRFDQAQFRISLTVRSATRIRPQLAFSDQTWDVPQNVLVSAVDDDVVDGGDAKVVAAVEGRVNAIRGPLTINGGIADGADRSLNDPFLLPGETNNPVRDGTVTNAGTNGDGDAFLTDDFAQHVNQGVGLEPGFDPRMNNNFYGFRILDGAATGAFMRVKSVDGNTVTFVGAWPEGIAPAPGDSYFYAPINPNTLVEETDQVDAAYIDNSDSPAADTGTLTETRLTGLGMGSDTVIATRSLLGGITYENLEVLDIELGYGPDAITVASTHAGSTTIHAGNGADTIFVESLLGHTFIDTGLGADVIELSSRDHLVDEVGALLTVVGGDDDDVDVLHVDDTGDPGDNSGTLTQTTLTGLDTPGTSEVQILSVLAVAGDYRLSYSDSNGTVLSDPLNYDLSATQLASALNALLNSTGIRVEKYRNTSKTVTYTITFGGDLAGQNVGSLAWGETAETTGLVAAADSSVNVAVVTHRDGTTVPQVNTVQTLTIDATGGTFRLGVQLDSESLAAVSRGLANVMPAYLPTIPSTGDTVLTAAIDFDIGAAELAKYLDPILNPNNSDNGLPHTRNFAVSKVGNVFVFTFQGEHAALGFDAADIQNALILDAGGSTVPGAAILETRTHGINYYAVEQLDIDLGSGHDVFNVQGTTSVTNLNLHDGQDKVLISSAADRSVDTIAGYDFLPGHLDLILGRLNIDAGSGTGQVLMISDEASTVGDPDVRISDLKPNVSFPDSEIYLTGLAPAGVSYQSASDGDYAGGITIWTGRGADHIVIDGTHERAGLRTITTLNTNDGEDDVTVDLSAGTGTLARDGFFVLNTEADNDVVDASQSTLPLVLFGGSGELDKIRGGQGDDVIFGDVSRVLFFDHTPTDDESADLASLEAAAAVVIGHAGPGDRTEGALHNIRLELEAEVTVGGRDTIIGEDGKDLIFGQMGDDLILGDGGLVSYDATGLVPVFAETSNPDTGNDDVITAGEGNNQVAGGFGTDDITTGGGRDFILGDNGQFEFNLGNVVRVRTTDVVDNTGGRDLIRAGEGDNIVLAGNGNDEVTAGSGSNLIVGDNGEARYADDGLVLLTVLSLATNVGGDDEITTGDGADIVVAGIGSDTVNAGNGDNVVIGDNGGIRFDGVDANPVTLDEVKSTAPADGGGDDVITTGTGNDIIIGGDNDGTGADPDYPGAEILSAGEGNNVVLGDNGVVTLHDGELDRIEGTDTARGGVDVITTGDADDTVIAGVGADIVFGGVGNGETINAGDGDNIIFGDSGFIVYVFDANGSHIGQASTSNPTLGDADTIISGSGNDLIFGGTDGDIIHAGAGNDLVFGDHGRVDGNVQGSFLPLSTLTPAFTFTAIDTHSDDLGGADIIHGEGGEDILLGQQGADVIHGGDDDDDLIGGHNVAGGHDGGDRLDGGSGDDVIAGDNASVLRRGDTLSQRFRVLSGGIIYDQNGLEQTVAEAQLDPANAAARNILLLDHSEIAGSETSGDDYLAGGADDDVIFGQLGNDVIQGDGSIDLVSDRFSYQSDGTVLNVGDPGDVGAGRANGLLWLRPSVESANDGDDYIEGNGGADVVFGNLGQDDIIGGSSELFGLGDNPSLRPDGTDMLFGGAGTNVSRNDIGDAMLVGDGSGNFITVFAGHALDADMILGDNGNVFRLVEPLNDNGVPAIDADGNAVTRFLWFNYDTSGANPYPAVNGSSFGERWIIPRAADLVDYTPGGADFSGEAGNVGSSKPALDIGADDEIHGESGDDFIYGQVGNDVMFGEGQDDDLIGGYGHDWISGGTGQDGVIGDDGRIMTSRNAAGYGEPLHGVAAIPAGELDLFIKTPGNIQTAVLHVSHALKKSVNLTPFNYDPNDSAQDNLFDPLFADDILYGGWQDDFLHGGPGDDAMLGGEALAQYYASPLNPGDVLGWSNLNKHNRAGEFAAYSEYEPRRKILVDTNGVFVADGSGVEFLLNFDQNEGPLDPHADGVEFLATPTDGDDVLFGDLGNDWIVGGTGKDTAWGGRGDDMMNMDDNHDTTLDDGDPDTGDRDNNAPDTHPSYEDRAYGGAGRDVLIGNTGGDRLIDWAGEFNSYIAPFAPFGNFMISRAIAPGLIEFLYDLSESNGADPTRSADTSADPDRNGEPEGEIGLVMQKDFDWQDQTGAPDDPQPGNIPGGSRDVLRGATFNNGKADGFAADSGQWRVENGRFEVEPQSLGGDAVSVFFVDNYLPTYFEMTATISGGKPTGGYKSNAFLIFDYHGPNDFKFAGANVSIDKLQMGHRDANGWHVDYQRPAQLKPDTDYNMLLSIHGTTATLVVDNDDVLSYVYAPRVVDGISYGLNTGMVGIGAENSMSQIDNVLVQILPRGLTLVTEEDFTDTVSDIPLTPRTGSWLVDNGTARYQGAPFVGEDWAVSEVDLGLVNGLNSNSLLQLDLTLNTNAQAGFVFDQYGPFDFKFLTIDEVADQIVIGHSTERRGWVTDKVYSQVIDPGTDYDLGLSLKGHSVSVTFDENVLEGYIFNGIVVDGGFGLISVDGSVSVDRIELKTDDPAFEGDVLSAAHDLTTTVLDTPVTVHLLGNDVLGTVPTFITDVEPPVNGGSVTFDPSAGTATYTPASGFIGTDSFTYTITDGDGQTSSATVTVNV